ncbi:hypothetical protein E8D34_02940 [Nocardioides sp. GY 10113]|nr:hypothetical protein E8D34_02940 [Nocardioides sp. GY 10113]
MKSIGPPPRFRPPPLSTTLRHFAPPSTTSTSCRRGPGPIRRGLERPAPPARTPARRGRRRAGSGRRDHSPGRPRDHRNRRSGARTPSLGRAPGGHRRPALHHPTDRGAGVAGVRGGAWWSGTWGKWSAGGARRRVEWSGAEAAGHVTDPKSGRSPTGDPLGWDSAAAYRWRATGHCGRETQWWSRRPPCSRAAPGPTSPAWPGWPRASERTSSGRSPARRRS